LIEKIHDKLVSLTRQVQGRKRHRHFGTHFSHHCLSANICERYSMGNARTLVSLSQCGENEFMKTISQVYGWLLKIVVTVD
jgi:hypothetical protein